MVCRLAHSGSQPFNYSRHIGTSSPSLQRYYRVQRWLLVLGKVTLIIFLALPPCRCNLLRLVTFEPCSKVITHNNLCGGGLEDKANI